jgi:PhzF family phenazine biosynthesis protein
MENPMRLLHTVAVFLLFSFSALQASSDNLGHSVHIVNAFSNHDQGGNPAAIVLNADNLSKEKMQTIAKQVGDLGLARMTAFISSPKDSKNDYRFQFFTPLKQIPHCGHATIAAFNYLSQNGVEKRTLLAKETIDGTRQIAIEGNRAFLEQLSPSYKDPFVSVSLDELGQALQISPQDIITTPRPEIVSTGNSFLVIGVKSADVLQKVKPNLPLIKEISEKLDLVAFYVFVLGKDNIDAETRMFGPRYGINEEAASGTAAGSLACYLHDKYNLKKSSFEIEQGRFMAPPSVSRIYVNLKFADKKIKSLQVGGYAHYVKRLEL